MPHLQFFLRTLLPTSPYKQFKIVGLLSDRHALLSFLWSTLSGWGNFFTGGGCHNILGDFNKRCGHHDLWPRLSFNWLLLLPELKAFLNFIFYWLMEEMVIYFNPANLNTSKFTFSSHPSLHNSLLSSLLYSHLSNLIYLIVITALQGRSVLHLNQKS